MSRYKQIPAFIALLGLMLLRQASLLFLFVSALILSALAYQHIHSPNMRA